MWVGSMRFWWVAFTLSLPAFSIPCSRMVSAHASAPGILVQEVPNICALVAITNGVSASLHALNECADFDAAATLAKLRSRYDTPTTSLWQTVDALHHVYSSCPSVQAHTQAISVRVHDRQLGLGERLQFRHGLSGADLYVPESDDELTYWLVGAHMQNAESFHGNHTFLHFGFDPSGAALLADPRGGRQLYPAQLAESGLQRSGYDFQISVPELVFAELPPVYTRVPEGTRAHIVNGVRVTVRKRP